VILCAAGSREPLLRAEHFAHPDAPPQVVLDLAVPHGIGAEVREVKHVRLFTIRDVADLATVTNARRSAARDAVEQIVGEETARFLAWRQSRDAEGLVADLRRRIESIRREQLGRLGADAPEEWRREADRLTDTVLRAALHDLTLNLRSLDSAADGDKRQLDLVRRLFNLPSAEA